MTELSFRVLRRLADAEFHSGAALARDFGVTRGTIWNAVHAIDAAGVMVYRVRGRGYRLKEPLSLLDAQTIARHAGPAGARFSVEVLDVADSTNTVLMQRAVADAANGTVIVAELQRSGRGRMGRSWRSDIGGALTFSVLWRFGQGAAGLAGLSLAAGVALVRALFRAGAADVQLKWPNDVVWRGRKLAGMLIEMQGDALGPSAVVIGVGINVRLSEATRRAIDQPAADLETACGRTLDRNAVLGTILAELAPMLDAFSKDGFAPIREEWQRHHAHQGRRVVVKLPGGRMDEGIARGVSEDGALLFESGNALRRLHSGEISLREAARPGVRGRA
jgi:BirA family biotin operon repressor/biotin-[acetyl-CoA-carboxylase] ligase